VRRLQLYGDLEHSRASVDKSINGDDNGKFKFNNGQRLVFDALMEATYDEARHTRSFVISSASGTGKTHIFNNLLDVV
jgi:superfamily II DNA or RNA helicase